MAVTLGVLDPFRFRGYVWDEETGLYYPAVIMILRLVGGLMRMIAKRLMRILRILHSITCVLSALIIR